jgi:hypothetical protein
MLMGHLEKNESQEIVPLVLWKTTHTMDVWVGERTKRIGVTCKEVVVLWRLVTFSSMSFDRYDCQQLQQP